MSENRFNAVAIARLLRDDIEAVSASLVVGPTVRYFRVDTLACLVESIKSLQKDLQTCGLLPMIHFEGHGFSDESGIMLSRGDRCTWGRLKNLVTPLNVQMALNLMLVFAACHGGSFVRAITTTDRAPVWGLIPEHGLLKH